MNEEDGRIVNGAGSAPATHRWGLLLLVPLAACLVTLFVLAAEWKDSLTVQRVVVEGAGVVPAQEVFAAANLRLGTPLCGIDLYGLQKRLSGHPFLRSVVVTRQYPDVLRVDVVEREPIASVNGGKAWYYVDREGTLLPRTQSRRLDLPVISGLAGIDRAAPGSRLTGSDIASAIEVLQEAGRVDSGLYRFISEVNVGPNGLTLYTNEAGVPILLGTGDALPAKLVLLQTFWSNFIRTENIAKLQYIDLRFDGQVVVKWNQQDHSPGKGGAVQKL